MVMSIEQGEERPLTLSSSTYSLNEQRKNLRRSIERSVINQQMKNDLNEMTFQK